MSVSVRDARDSASDRRWMASVYRDFLDDLSSQDTGLFPMLGEAGHSEPDQLARWFGDPRVTPLVIARAGTPVGFAVVARGAATPGRARVDFRMAEFFVTRPQRRLGVGRSAVPLILDRFGGRWEIVELLRNTAAVRFWRRAVSAYTGGAYEERVANGEVRQTFLTGSARDSVAQRR